MELADLINLAHFIPSFCNGCLFGLGAALAATALCLCLLSAAGRGVSDESEGED